MKKTVMYVLFAILAAGVGVASYQWQLQRGAQTTPTDNAYKGYTGGDFTLDSFAGKVSLSDFKGMPVLIYFGYTYCPDVCPNSLAVMGEAIKLLETETKVKGLLVSIDPERDTLEKLRDYAPYFHPNITGLNGSVHRLLEIATRYGVYYKKVEREEQGEYLMDHTSRFYLIGPDSKLAGVINHGASPTEVAQRVRALVSS